VLLIQIIALVVLLLIFVQDMRSRSVHWVLFPVLIASFIAMRFMQQQAFEAIWQPVLINILFLVFQLLAVSAYFSLKERKLVNITSGILGWGDILFLLSTAFYLPVVNFLFFYIASLTVIVLTWLSWQLISKEKVKYIPLAGLQALLFAIFFSFNLYFTSVNLNSDDWLLNLINK